MQCTDQTRETLLAWLDSREAWVAMRAVSAAGMATDGAPTVLSTVTENPASADGVVNLTARARAHAGLPAGSVAIERWLLIRHAVESLTAGAIPALGQSAQQLTCDEIASLTQDDDATRAMLDVSGIRFRELAKLVTGRRYSAGLFCWDECGLSRSWLVKVPPRSWHRFARTLLAFGGLAPIIYPHVNPRRGSPRLEEPAISRSFAAMAESIEHRPDVCGFAAASWLWSPDTHRVSPHLAALNAPIVGNGGFVATIGPASPDCGVFARSGTRRRLYDEGAFKPTVGLVLWPRAQMVAWRRATS
jgi:hypothetical protein